EVPLLMGLALAATPFIGWWAVVLVVLVHNTARIRLTLWGLDLGLREGLRGGAALEQSQLKQTAATVQRAASFAVGLGLPIAGTWLLGTTAPREWAPVAAA